MKIQALHEFHDPIYSKEWAKKFTPTKPRLDLFKTILSAIADSLVGKFHIVELGIGPGYLAEFLLRELDEITYEGIDFSEPMLEIAAARVEEHANRCTFTVADLTQRNWTDHVCQPAMAVVTTWALHDLFDAASISHVYQRVFEILPNKGLFLNGDFIKPEESTIEYEGGRIKPSRHLELLKSVGFKSVRLLEEFEKDVEKPTTANNYACFLAIK